MATYAEHLNAVERWVDDVWKRYEAECDNLNNLDKHAFMYGYLQAEVAQRNLKIEQLKNTLIEIRNMTGDH